MELVRVRLKYIRDVLFWIKTEADMVQWAGHVFTWPLTEKPSLYPFVLSDRKRVVGYCELSQYRRDFNSAMLSRVIVSPKRRNKGLGTFMINEVLRFGFTDLGLNRIGLGVFDFNKAAIRCYTRVGFVSEGTLRRSAKVGKSYWNCRLMSILRKELKKNRWDSLLRRSNRFGCKGRKPHPTNHKAG
jgi:RimJ/RimL family protein N-acetyltransferase